MKISRIIALLLAVIMIFAMVSCDHSGHGGGINDPHNNANNQHNQNGNNGTGDNEGEGEEIGDSEENEDNKESEENDSVVGSGEGKVTYVYSVLSKVLHLPDCYHIGRINELYKAEHTGDITPLLEDGFTICKDCLVPDDEKDDEEEEEEDENKIAKEDATYAINKNSNVLHTLECYHLDVIVEKNLEYTDLTLEELLALELRPCAVCLPEEAEEYKKNHPEEYE